MMQRHGTQLKQNTDRYKQNIDTRAAMKAEHVTVQQGTDKQHNKKLHKQGHQQQTSIRKDRHVKKKTDTSKGMEVFSCRMLKPISS